MRLTNTLLLASVLAQTAPSVSAQQTEGTLMGAPVAFGVAAGTSIGPLPADPRAIQRKTAGYVGAEEMPAFDMTMPVQWGELPFVDQPFEVDALSIGLDVVNATTPVGGVSLIDFSASEAWGTILFTVESGSPGAPGSVIETQLSSPDGNGADLFSANLPGSFFEPPVEGCYPLGARLSTDALDMGIAPLPGSEVRWVDMFIPRYDTGQAAADEFGAPDFPVTVYFSIRSEDAPDAPASWFAGPKSGATILKTSWVSGGWSPPVTHLSYFELGLAKDDDVDALAVDEDRCKALFSIEAKTGLIGEQFQIVEWPCTDGDTRGAFSGGGVMVGEYQSVPGTAVGRDLDLDDGSEVDGFCDEDPGGQAADCSVFIGTPMDAKPLPKELSMQIYRDDTPFGTGTFTFVVDGVSGGPGDLLVIFLNLGVGVLAVHTEPVSGPRATIALTSPTLDVPMGPMNLACPTFFALVTSSPKSVSPDLEIGAYF